jgi:HK97 family phage prohead protease
MMEKRFLSAGIAGIELRKMAAAAGADADETNVGRTIVGYAAKFNVRSAPMGNFYEVVAPGAFDGCLTQDVVALFNHDESLVLARSGAGSLLLAIDEIGLRYEFTVADDEVSERVAGYIADGRVSQSSFAFNVPDDGGGDHYEITPDGQILRTITRIEFLYDVSPVTRPAYPEATVVLRSAFDARQQAEQTLIRREAQQRAVVRARELELLGAR